MKNYILAPLAIIAFLVLSLEASAQGGAKTYVKEIDLAINQIKNGNYVASAQQLLSLAKLATVDETEVR